MTSQSTHNLIGFLAKKSLFKAQNTTKQITYSDAHSFKDPFSQSITPKVKNQYRSQISQFNVFRDSSQKQLHRKGVSEIQKSSRTLNSTAIRTSQQNRFEKIKPKQIYFSHLKQNIKQQNPETASFFKSTNAKSNNLFIGFNPSPQKTQSKTFQSLQLQAQQCLQNMSYQLSEEIHKLSENIQLFNAKMFKMLSSELQSVKYKIVSMIDEVFKESEKNIRSYIKQQQSQLLEEALLIRTQLEKQQKKIRQMSLRIKTNEWRKTAAEMIGDDMQNHVNNLIEKAQLIELKPPQIYQQQKNDKINELSKNLKEITQIKNYLK